MSTVPLHVHLDDTARRRPATPIHFPDEDESVTAAGLAARSAAAAARLEARGARPGDRVGILAPNAPEFLVALFACSRIGAAAAPLSLPMGADVVDWAVRLRGVLAAGGIERVVVSHRLADRVAPALADGPLLIDDRDLDGADVAPPTRTVDVDAPVVVQFTSGSTARPKGVVLTHANVAHCLRAIATAIDLRDDDVHGAWLPLFHDMGLFGALTAILHGVPAHLWSPAGFVRRPARWLAAFAASGATICAMPNFGYDTLVATVDAEQAERLDLSRWRIAFDGAEAVSAAASAAFLERFAPAGLRPGVLLPAYGMAEVTLAATLPPPGRPLRVEHVDRDLAARTGEAVPVAPDDPRARALVGLGSPVPGLDLRIAGDDGPRPDGGIGEIQLRGPMATRGYLAGTADDVELYTADGWLRSGDLGYLRDGELFFTGRRKEMVTVAGRNLYPADVEDVVRDLPGVHRGRCVALTGADDDGGERIELVVETADPRDPATTALVEALRARVAAALGALPLLVLPVPPRTIPRTTSGKVRRLDTRDRVAALGRPVPGASA